jgi:DNA-binding transcriptional regulator YhcF (GntR family)
MSKRLNGFIKIHRKILDWEWYSNANVKIVFLHLLLTATYNERSHNGIKLFPGQVIVSTRSLAQATGLSRQNVRTALSNLESSDDIKIVSNGGFSTVTINNWELYQVSEQLTHQSTHELTHQLTHELTTYKENKEYKESKEDVIDKCVYSNNFIKGNGQREHTHPYGEFSNVFLTDEEYERLTSKYMRVNQLIDKVSIWLTEHTRKNHYAACLLFARNDSWEKRKADTKRVEVEEKKMTEEEKRQAHEMARKIIDNLKKI